MVVDGVEADTIRHTMELTLDNLALRHQRSIALFKAMGTFFPAWGMIGTLVGLISLLLALNDPAKIGSSMAIAMVTTFYGSVLANFFAIPVANRLQEQSREECVSRKWCWKAFWAFRREPTQESSNPFC